MTALNTFIVLKRYGGKVFEAYVDQTYDLAKSFFQLLKEDMSLETIHEPEANIICFRIVEKNKNEKELNRINKFILDSINKSGDFYIVQTTIKGVFYLRVCIMNPFTELVHLKELLSRIKNTSKQVQ